MWRQTTLILPFYGKFYNAFMAMQTQLENTQMLVYKFHVKPVRHSALHWTRLSIFRRVARCTFTIYC